jgi:uncharacterized repeat protein (TIGR04138 family)
MAEPPPIDVDLPCAACGYNLRGLAVAGRCPECGAPVIASVREAEANDLGLYERLRRSLAHGIAAQLGYPPDAVMFVADACTYSTKGDEAGTGRPPPLGAEAACRAVRRFAATYFHSPDEARELLAAWGIARSEDVGRIVVALAASGWLDAVPGLGEADFAGRFETATLFAARPET